MHLGLALNTFAAASTAGIASSMVLDRMIDLSAHDHSTFAYRHASKTTWVLAGGAAALGVAGLVARQNTAWRDASDTMLAASAGLAGAWAATLGVRLAYAMTVEPRTLEFLPSDLAGNSISRLRMMGRDYPLDNMPAFDVVSRLQGHPNMVDRASELAPVIPR